ncbi:MAG TPA: tRNA isopentenyl-2-thiomethyl-A-37 hydroxylase MiaE [Myxococcota bacterium]|jgi:tRNA-(ms[2]io[6]A)-hydroxylase|nr:tRNA isopentenyl-2-thiomethyl-A-37 hydroxylase MiaE [Myxococcota bacterium]
MLRLAAATHPAWGRFAAAHLDAVLLDHAHCEKKAAGTAVGLLFRYPHRSELQAPLAALAREELGHFEAVLAQLARRGLRFAPQSPAPYAGLLHRSVRREDPARELDLLLCAAAIEARSCERLTLLADAVDDAPLRELLRGLLAAEARHHRLYVELAEALHPRATVRARLDEVLAREAEAIAAAPPALPRLHAGPLDAS